MGRARRIAVDVGVGMAAAVVITTARRATALRKLDQGLPVRRSLWIRRVQRERARATKRWAATELGTLRAFLTASEYASVQLTIWHNARRTSESMLDAAQTVRETMSGAVGSPATGSARHALEAKLAGLRADAEPQQQVAAIAQSELERLQATMRERVGELRRDAPPAVTTLARRLVAAHETARRGGSGHLDELLARRQLDELSTLREELESILSGLVDATA